MNIALLNVERKRCYFVLGQTPVMHIGKRIKALMAEKRISNLAMAGHCGVTPGAVSNWFSTGRISKEHLAKVAAFLKVDLAGLISGDEAPAPTPDQALRYSAQALMLAAMLDRVPVAQNQRLLAYVDATNAVAPYVPGRELPPTETPLLPDPAKRSHAKH